MYMYMYIHRIIYPRSPYLFPFLFSFPEKKILTKFPLLRTKRRRSNILSTTTTLLVAVAAAGVVGALRSSSKKFIA